MPKAKPATANSAGAPAPPPTDLLKPIFQSSFGLVSQKDTLARAKPVMDNLSKALGAAAIVMTSLSLRAATITSLSSVGSRTTSSMKTLRFKEFALFHPIEPTKANQ